MSKRRTAFANAKKYDCLCNYIVKAIMGVIMGVKFYVCIMG
jgi:hypothetical protein